MSGKKEYVKLWLSYRTYFESYTPEQVGNLALAMLAYKDTGEEPEFYGPERFIWPAIKRDINEAQAAQAAAAQQARENGKKGGRPRKAPSENPFDNPFGNPFENPPGFSETQETTWTKDIDIDNSHRQGQGQEQEQEKEKEKEYTQAPARARKKMSTADRLLAQLMREAQEEAARETGDFI